MQPSIDDWVKENLMYDPETGYLWRIKCNSGRNFDKPVGYLCKTKGYVRVTSWGQGNKKNFLAHRLAWFLYYGVWPKDQVDHINNIKDDNRIVNLREATGFENQANRKIQVGGSSKYKGVCWHKRHYKWRAKITVNHKLVHLGYYNSEENAALAYNKAALEYFGEFAKINDLTP